MNQETKNLRIYPVPKEAVLQEDYCLRVRSVGAEDWHELKAYRVKVDMHDVRCRWDNYGGSREITVRNMTLWADVAHPTMIGTHGDRNPF